MLHLLRAGRRAGCRASHAGSHVQVALVGGHSRDCRVCRRVPRRVPDRARVGVFCSLLVTLVLVLGCGWSPDFRVCRRVTRRLRSRWCVLYFTCAAVFETYTIYV